MTCWPSARSACSNWRPARIIRLRPPWSTPTSLRWPRSGRARLCPGAAGADPLHAARRPRVPPARGGGAVLRPGRRPHRQAGHGEWCRGGAARRRAPGGRRRAARQAPGLGTGGGARRGAAATADRVRPSSSLLVSVATSGALGRLLPLYFVLVAAVLALGWRALRGSEPRPLSRPVAAPAAAFFAFALASLLWADDVEAGANLLAFFTLPFAALIVVVAQASYPDWVPRALGRVAIAPACSSPGSASGRRPPTSSSSSPRTSRSRTRTRTTSASPRCSAIRASTAGTWCWRWG